MELSVAVLFQPFKKPGPRMGKKRITLFIEKYKNQDEFELNTGSKVKFIFEPETYKMLVEASKYPSKYQKELTKSQFLAAKGKQYYKITDLKKTIEFEGQPDKPPAGIEGEYKTVERLNTILSNIIKAHGYKDGVPVVCKGKIYKVVRCIKVEGTPKSDFAMLDIKGNEVVWISYKMGKSVKDFQQWGGISDPIMQSFSQVQDFITKMKKRFPKGLASGQNAGMKIKGNRSSLIKAKAVYGFDYDPSHPLGRNNVSFVVQGRIDLKETSSGKYTIISTTSHAYENGSPIKSSEEPIFFCKYTSDRGQFGLEHTRFTISPYDTSTIKEWIE